MLRHGPSSPHWKVYNWFQCLEPILWACNLWFCATHNMSCQPPSHQMQPPTTQCLQQITKNLGIGIKRENVKKNKRARGQKSDQINQVMGGGLWPPDPHTSTTTNGQRPHVHSLITGTMSALCDNPSPSNRVHYMWRTTLLHPSHDDEERLLLLSSPFDSAFDFLPRIACFFLFLMKRVVCGPPLRLY